MSADSVIVVATGTANTASVMAALGRLGEKPRISEDPADVDKARALILPGVGTFGAAMAKLEDDGMVDPLRARLESGRPTLAICLGMQILCSNSDENPQAQGLGIVNSRITRFRDEVRVPQFGWNSMKADAGCRFLTDGYAYFANSYRLESAPGGWSAAMAGYGGPFVAAMEKGMILACQFHPELSGRWGLELIERWLGAVGGESC